ncbi:hypothetical protein ACFLYT_01160 [Nanoarchaeota archaeon]
MSLSINAIVVLVLAIAMLGLGLAFTKGMFQKIAGKIDIPAPDIPASAEEPIILPIDELTIKHGDGMTFSVNFYNDYTGGKVDVALQCSDWLSATGPNDPLGITTKNTGITCDNKGKPCDVRTSPQFVDSGTYKSFKIIIPDLATTTENIGEDVCEISFCAPGPGETEGFFNNGVCTSGSADGHLETKQIVFRVT